MADFVRTIYGENKTLYIKINKISGSFRLVLFACKAVPFATLNVVFA